MDINLQLRLGLVNQFIDRYIQATVKKSFDNALHNNTLDRATEYLKGNLAVQSKIMAVTINTAYPDVFYSMYDIADYVEKYIKTYLKKEVKNYFKERINNPFDDIIVSSDGVVIKVIRNNKPNRFFDEEGNELLFNDPDEVDKLYMTGNFSKGDRLFYSVSMEQMNDKIINSGLIHDRWFANMPTSGPIYWVSSWIKAIGKGHGDFDFSEKYLIGLSNERIHSDNSLVSRNRTSYVDGTAFFRFGNTNNTIYNLYDAGNYMWGRAMGMSGFSYGEIRFGSRANEFFFDADADQRAIKKGFFNQ